MNINLNALDGTDSLLWSGGGQAVQGFAYSPYGGGPVRNGDMLLGFNGERLDPISQTYHLGNGYRTYNPALMRFTAPDSWSPFGAGGLNAYAYCEGDPINRTDPSGHMSWQAGVGIGLGLLSILGTVLSLGMAIPAEGVMAGLLSLDAADVLAGGLGLAAGVTSIASDATQDSNPRASEILGWISFGLGLASVGVHAGKMVRGKLKRRPATILLNGEEIELRPPPPFRPPPIPDAESLGSDSSSTIFDPIADETRAPMGGVLAQDGENRSGRPRSASRGARSNWSSESDDSSRASRQIPAPMQASLVTRNAQGALVLGDDSLVRPGRYQFALSAENNLYLANFSFGHPMNWSDSIRWPYINTKTAGSVWINDGRIMHLANCNVFYPNDEATFRTSARTLMTLGLIDNRTKLTYLSDDGPGHMFSL